MAENKKSGSQVFTPGKGDALSNRHIHQTEQDRAQQIKDFREQKEYETQLKEERFSRIRKQRGDRAGNGITVTIETEKK